MRIEGRVFRKKKWWVAEISMFEIVTQGHTRSEAVEMVQDAIEELADHRFNVFVFRGRGTSFQVGSSDETALFAFLLRRQRQAQGLSLADMSQRLGFSSRNAYARYEQGKAIPTLTKLFQLLRAVNPNRDLVLTQTVLHSDCFGVLRVPG